MSFYLGTVVGAVAGLSIACLCFAGRRADDAAQQRNLVLRLASLENQHHDDGRRLLDEIATEYERQSVWAELHARVRAP